MSGMSAAGLKTALDSSKRQVAETRRINETTVSAKVNSARRSLSSKLQACMEDFTQATGLHVSTVHVSDHHSYSVIEIRLR